MKGVSRSHRAQRGRPLKKRYSPHDRCTPVKGIRQDGRKYKATYAFYSFGIHATRLSSLEEAKLHRRLMESTKLLVEARFRELALAGKSPTRKDFIEEVKKTVVDVRAPFPNLRAWRYYSNIERVDGKIVRLRSCMSESLDVALKGWCKLCASAGVTDVGALALDRGPQSAGRAGDVEDGSPTRRARRGRLVKKKYSSSDRCTIEKGIRQDGRKYKSEYFFYSFGIHATRLRSLDEAKLHHTLMASTKLRVQTRLSKHVAAGKCATRKDFVQAVKKTVIEVRAPFPNLRPWRYFSNIERLDGRIVRLRSCFSESLDVALKGWCKLVASVGVSDITALLSFEEKRRVADAFAEQALQKLPEGAWPSNATALSVLRLWGFDKNVSRENVFPDGNTWVHSDTLGLVTNRYDRKMIMSRHSVGYNNFHRLLCLWMRSCLPAKLRDQALPHTSISVNKGYAAKLHRDRGNEGPSVGITTGNFSGGGLRVWPDDCKVGDVELLHKQPSTTLNLHNKALVFDGNCGHEVEPFRGERFSLVFFTARNYRRASSTVRDALEKVGHTWPSSDSLQRLRQYTPKRLSRSLGAKAGAGAVNDCKDNGAHKVLRRAKLTCDGPRSKRGAVGGKASKVNTRQR